MADLGSRGHRLGAEVKREAAGASPASLYGQVAQERLRIRGHCIPLKGFTFGTFDGDKQGVSSVFPKSRTQLTVERPSKMMERLYGTCSFSKRLSNLGSISTTTTRQ